MAGPFMFLGIDLSTVNWYLVLYAILSIAAVAMGTSQLFPMGTSTAVIYAIGSIMILYFYYTRWFGDSATTPSTWPPTINTCPDYFTYIESLPGDKKPGCVDMLGISKNNGYRPPTTTELTTLNSTDTNVFGFTSSSATTRTKILQICTLCKQKGITWEGIFDGDTCVGAGDNSAASAANKASCKL
jgi:hypothetical protein